MSLETKLKEINKAKSGSRVTEALAISVYVSVYGLLKGYLSIWIITVFSLKYRTLYLSVHPNMLIFHALIVPDTENPWDFPLSISTGHTA